MALYKCKLTSSQHKANKGLVLLDSSARYYAHIHIKTKQYHIKVLPGGVLKGVSLIATKTDMVMQAGRRQC